MTFFIRFYDTIIKGSGYAGASLIGAITAITFLDLVLRNLFAESISWQLDFVEYALLASTFLMAPWILSLGAHVRVDFLLGFLPPPVVHVLDKCVNILGVILCLMLAYFGLQETISSAQRGVIVIKELVFPEWWALLFVPYTFFLGACEFSLRVLGLRAGNESLGV